MHVEAGNRSESRIRCRVRIQMSNRDTETGPEQADTTSNTICRVLGLISSPIIQFHKSGPISKTVSEKSKGNTSHGTSVGPENDDDDQGQVQKLHTKDSTRQLKLNININ